MPKLRLHSPASIPGVGSSIAIPGDDVTVGRGPDNAVIIPESSVSLRHARLQRKAGAWVLTDLGDTNGIWVGVKRVAELELQRGQLFRIGGVALEFVDDAVDPAAPQDAPAPLQVAALATAAHDSGIREPRQRDIKDETIVDAPLTLLRPLESTQERKQTPLPQKPQRSAPMSIQRVAAGLFALIVLGFAVTFGGYFALRWMSKSGPGSRAMSSIAKSEVTAKPLTPAASTPPQALLADKTVDNVAEEQRVDVPDLISLTLPPSSLHTPTHLVVAHSVKQGTPFCSATDFAGPVFEIETPYNRIWAHPGTAELAVDVEQLAKSRVAAVAIGLFDQTKQTWQLLPTEYDSNSRRAKAQLWQPGLLALFFVTGPDNVASSEHFELLIEPSPANPGKPARDHALKALVQMESALSQYRQAGYRVPAGHLWACAASSTIHRAMALLPVVSRAELSRAHSQSVARAAFATLIPAYVNSRSVEGREFWFDAMLTAVASQAVGLRVAGNNTALKRLQNPLLAEDWPSAPLYLNLVSRTVDQHVDLFRIWTETTHVMNDLDTKAGAEGQSPVLAIELALQQATQKSLLDQYTDFVTERLSAAPAGGSNANSPERCQSLVSVPPDAKSGTLPLDVPGHYTARWACLSLDVPAGKYRNIKLQLAADPPSGLNLRLLRLSTGQILETAWSGARHVRLDLVGPETFMIVGVNSNMAQNANVALHYDDTTIGATIEGPASISIRPGQNVSSNLQLTGIFPELKNLDVEWDYGDGSPKERSNLAVNGAIHVERSHVWTKAGSFTLRASVFDPAQPKQEIAFVSRQITVQPVQLELTVLDANPQAQSEVKFLAKVSGPSPEGLQFRLNFGDNSDSLISAAPNVSHRYASAGEYAVTADLLSSLTANEVIASSKVALTVRTADSPATVTSAPSPPALVPAPASSGSVQ